MISRQASFRNRSLLVLFWNAETVFSLQLIFLQHDWNRRHWRVKCKNNTTLNFSQLTEIEAIWKKIIWTRDKHALKQCYTGDKKMLSCYLLMVREKSQSFFGETSSITTWYLALNLRVWKNGFQEAIVGRIPFQASLKAGLVGQILTGCVPRIGEFKR